MKTIKKPLTRLIADEEVTQVTKVWSLPNVEKTLSDDELAQTNAMSKQRRWQYEPPEQEIEEEIVPLTAEEIEEIRQAAYQEGFEQGKAEGFAAGKEEGLPIGQAEGFNQGKETGYSEGLSEGQETIKAQLKNFEAIVEQLHQPLRNLDHQVEQELITLAASLAEAIVMAEVKTNPEVIISALNAGVKALPTKDSQIFIYLCPDDLTVVESLYGEEALEENGWSLMRDPQLEQGSCRVENATSNVDLRLKTRIKDVVDSFLHDALSQ